MTPVIAYDHTEACWRIGFASQIRLRDGRVRKAFDAILWLRFASREAATHHLAWRGAW